MPGLALRSRFPKQRHAAAALVVVLSLGGGGITASSARASEAFAIVDTLGAATPTTKFDRNDSGGLSVSAFQQVGPQFTLTQQTVITEIGGFIADGGVFGTAPLVVQIHPSANGSPDPSTVLATVELSTDGDPLVTSYESVAPNLTLGEGSYYALFAEPEGSPADHFLLCCAFSPFEYRAGSPVLGALCSGAPCETPPGFPAAVRILGRPSVDTTPPVLTTPGTIVVDATSPAGATVPYEATATDDSDPSPTVTCDPPSGSVFPIGTTIVGCTATDSSGNEANGTFNVHVTGAAEQLAGLREAAEGAGAGTSLAAKAGAALAAQTAGDQAGACAILSAFINQLKAQSGKNVPATTASALIADAARIRAVIGC
jgi:HYR domain